MCVLLRQDPHLRAELLLLRLPGGRVLLQVGGLLLVLRAKSVTSCARSSTPRAQAVQFLDVLILIRLPLLRERG